MRTEEIEKLFRELKNSFEAGDIKEEDFQREIEDLLFQDDAGKYWTMGARTEKWYRYDDGEWIQSAPPPTLEPVRHEGRPPGIEQKPPLTSRKRIYISPVALGLVGVSFLICLIVVALISYQFGRRSLMTRPVEYAPTATITATQVATVEPTLPIGVGTASPSPTEVERTATPVPTAIQEASPTPIPPTPTPTPTRAPSPTRAPQPTATPISTPEMKYGPPVLVGPEDGAIFGPRYDVTLAWGPQGELAEGEYYHVTVCWNGCQEFWGGFTDNTNIEFPPYHRSLSYDDFFYWWVIVRAQRSNRWAGNPDPAISPPSETWAFQLPER